MILTAAKGRAELCEACDRSETESRPFPFGVEEGLGNGSVPFRELFI